MRRLTSAIVVTVLLSACATGAGVAVLKREPPPSAEQLAQRQRLVGGGTAMRPTAAERFDVAVVGGACAPRPTSKEAVVACVDQRPCNGLGLRTPDGKIVCACYQVAGGCESDSYCDGGTRTCRKEGEDKYPVR